MLVVTSQGFGDRILMARYYRKLKQLGAQVIGVAGPTSIRPLFQAMPEVDCWHDTNDAIPYEAYDFTTRCMTLPGLCGTTTLDQIPAELPYLKADPRLIKHWAPRMATKHLRVGLVWSGSPTLSADSRRSIPLTSFQSLCEMPGVQLFSLQFGPGRSQLEHFGGRDRLIDFMGEVDSWGDTAAIVSNLDLVISVDTSVAHLAGALGKPVWMLSRFDGSHLWLLNRNDSPWYPDRMRIFQQPEHGDWDTPIEQVNAALKDLMESVRPRTECEVFR
jgi:hypothetical protein